MQCTRGGLSTAAGEHRHSCPFEVHLRCAFQADSRELWARRCRPVMCSEAGPGRSAPASRRWCFSTVLLVLSGVRTNRWKKGFKFTSLTGLLYGLRLALGIQCTERRIVLYPSVYCNTVTVPLYTFAVRSRGAGDHTPYDR
jgi:hypothetical protein